MLDGQRELAQRETVFGAEEIFYSRTDRRGVIRAGNSVFFRVSGYSADQMVGAPHRIVRHPDMPKGVFWLVWNMLGRDEAVAAYVKNRSADGTYYWAFAILRPIPDGYLSVRIKPGSRWLSEVMPIYEAMIENERNGMTPADSAAWLLDRLKTLGFADYPSFMAEMVHAESVTRYERRHDQASQILHALPTIRTKLKELGREQAGLIDEFDRLQMLPTNMRLVATRMESAGGPITAVSERYRDAVASLLDGLRAVTAKNGEPEISLERKLTDATIEIGNLMMQQECGEAFGADPFQVEALDTASEIRLLAEMSKARTSAANAHLVRVAEAVRLLGKNCTALRKSMIGLDQLRIMGEIESGRLRETGELSVLMEQLGQFHTRLRDRLQKLVSLSHDLHSLAMRNVS